MTVPPIDSSTAAFLAGLATSLHCAGMCGPVACVFGGNRAPEADAGVARAVYHGARLSAYVALGAVAGGVGRVPLAWLGSDAARWAPWLLVILLLALALRLDRRLPKPVALARLSLALPALARKLGPVGGAAIVGAATPVLPCAPLYLVVAMATFAGSALRGAEWMLAFGLGTVPLLWIAQAQIGWLRRHLGSAGLARLQFGLALGAALVVAWRARGALGFTGPDPASFVCF
jgi:sulfite exporter TauE/SafE